jgi:hypothetical protein
MKKHDQQTVNEVLRDSPFNLPPAVQAHLALLRGTEPREERASLYDLQQEARHHMMTLADEDGYERFYAVASLLLWIEDHSMVALTTRGVIPHVAAPRPFRERRI